MRVRTTSASEAPTSCSACSTISMQRRICAAGSASSAPTGPVPETSTRSPTRTARLNPISGSNGEPDEARRRSTSASGGPDLLRRLVAFLAGRPELVARLRLLDRDRLGGLDHQVHGLAHRDVLAQRLVAPLGLRPVERLLQLALARLRAPGALGGGAQR